jgi:hypothetical protein
LVGSRLKVVLKNVAKTHNIVCEHTCYLLVVLEEGHGATRTGLAAVWVLPLLIKVKLDEQRLGSLEAKRISPFLRIFSFVVADLPVVLVEVDCCHEEALDKIRNGNEKAAFWLVKFVLGDLINDCLSPFGRTI